jgi:hypothetical protein
MEPAVSTERDYTCRRCRPDGEIMGTISTARGHVQPATPGFCPYCRTRLEWCDAHAPQPCLPFCDGGKRIPLGTNSD